MLGLWEEVPWTMQFAHASGSTVHAIPLLDRYTFKCEYPGCHTRYTEQGNLDMHIRAKQENITYDCIKCDARLSTKCGLKRHYIFMHDMTEEEVLEGDRWLV